MSISDSIDEPRAESRRAQRVAEIEKRLSEATPGPWEVEEQVSTGWEIRRAKSPGGQGYITVGGDNTDDPGAFPDEADARLAAHAPTDLAWLLGELASVQRALTEAKQKLDKVTEAEYRALEEAARQRDIVRNTQRALTKAHEKISMYEMPAKKPTP